MSEKGLNSQELRRYWGVILRRKYLALSIALGILSLCTLAAFLMPEVYEASSTVFIQRSTMADPLIQGTPGVSSSMEERLRTVKDRITSRHIIEKVVKTLNLDANIKDNRMKLESLITGMQKAIAVNVKSSEGRGSADLFVISYQGENPQKVRDIVNTLTNVYVEDNTTFSRSEANSAFEFLTKQVAEYKTKLEESDAALIAFRAKYPRVAVASREFSSPMAIVPPLTPEQTRLNELNRQLATLVSKYTESHPEVIKTRAEIAEVRREAALSSIARNATTVQRRSAAPASKGVVAPAPETAGFLSGLSSKAQEEWMKLQHDRNVQQKIYDDLMQKLESSRVNKDLEFTKKASAFRVTDPAILPYTPIKPDRIRFILVGLFLGIAAGVGTAFGLEHLHHSFTDEDSIESSLGLPVLVSIPTVNNAAENLAARKLDKKVLIAASAYLSIIILVLMREVMIRYLGINF